MLEDTKELDPTGTGVEVSKADGTSSNRFTNAARSDECDLAPAILACFAKADPTTMLELSHVDTVREARRTDNAKYAEGCNPYRIRYGVYNLAR